MYNQCHIPKKKERKPNHRYTQNNESTYILLVQQSEKVLPLIIPKINA